MFYSIRHIALYQCRINHGHVEVEHAESADTMVRISLQACTLYMIRCVHDSMNGTKNEFIAYVKVSVKYRSKLFIAALFITA